MSWRARNKKPEFANGTEISFSFKNLHNPLPRKSHNTLKATSTSSVPENSSSTVLNSYPRTDHESCVKQYQAHSPQHAFINQKYTEATAAPNTHEKYIR